MVKRSTSLVQYITERNSYAVKTVVLAYTIHQAIQGISGDEELLLARNIQRQMPSAGQYEAEVDALREALPTLSDDDVEWLFYTAGVSAIRFLAIRELEKRPHIVINGRN